MKKTLSLLLALVMCLSLCACGANEEQLTAQEQLTELENKLFNCLITITSKDFIEPHTIRVTEICDYKVRTTYDENDYRSGPDTIVVRLMAKKASGESTNFYYLICIEAGEKKTSDAQAWIELYSDPRWGDKEKKMEYKAVKNEYTNLGVSYSPETDASDLFDIARINSAIKEHWEQMGF